MASEEHKASTLELSQMAVLIRPAVAARLLHVHPVTVKRWIDSGILAGVRLPNGQRRARARAVEAAMELSGLNVDDAIEAEIEDNA